MNFTREPIIETIISSKEGHKLLVRNSKGENFEEHYVDALEVVSFGRAFFFRSLERPKAFLVPVSDYEILEVKEARVALKNASHEKSIKIGGGREAPMRPTQREPKESLPEVVETAAASSSSSSEETALETAVESRMDRKRDRRRHRRRRGGGYEEREKVEQPEQKQEEPHQVTEEETAKGPSLFSTLIPPPPTLISETLSRYREKEAVEIKVESEEQEPPLSQEAEPGTDSTPLHRVTPQMQDAGAFNVSYFIPLLGGNDPFF